MFLLELPLCVSLLLLDDDGLGLSVMVEEATVELTISVLVVFGSLVVGGVATGWGRSVPDTLVVSAPEPIHESMPLTIVATPQEKARGNTRAFKSVPP